MRLLVVSACVAAIATAPALASPRRLLCVVHPDAIATAALNRSARSEPVQPRARVTVPDVHRVHLDARPPRAVLASSHTHDDDDRDMPWIWRMLRARALSHLPHHDATRFSLALTPVVVTSPSESIPGVGVAGHF